MSSNPPKKHNRKTQLVLVGVICILLLGAGLTYTYYSESTSKSEALTQAQYQTAYLNYTLQEVNASIPQTSFTLEYMPEPPATIGNNIVTYLFGRVEVSNLSSIYYPSTLMLSFNVSYATTGTAQISCQYVPYQMIYLVKGITTVQAPFGIYPLTILNATQNELITFQVGVTARIYWTPLNTVIGQEQTEGIMQVRVSY